MKLTKKFGKYSVELEVTTEDGSTPTDETYAKGLPTYSECFISHKTRAGREYSASLAMAEDTAVLWNTVYGEIDIEPAIVDEISEWAIENGY